MFVSDIIRGISSKTLEQLIRFSLKKKPSSFNQIYNESTAKVFHGFRNISGVPKKLLLNQLVKDSLEHDFIAVMILEKWFNNNSELREKINKLLSELNYKVIKPDFSKNFISHKGLNKKDIKQENELTYFAPRGKFIKGIDPVESTLMALLWGWFSDEDDKEDTLNVLHASISVYCVLIMEI